MGTIVSSPSSVSPPTIIRALMEGAVPESSLQLIMVVSARIKKLVSITKFFIFFI
jgi:hypothetical protein